MLVKTQAVFFNRPLLYKHLSHQREVIVTTLQPVAGAELYQVQFGLNEADSLTLCCL